MARDKSEYALLWANGMTFGEVFDLMEAEIREEYVTIVLFDDEPVPFTLEYDESEDQPW